VATLAPMAVLAIIIGLYPESVLSVLRVSVAHLLVTAAPPARVVGGM
jgi:NADH:ubiquinone oxidoreductase subunit 4 (subunit M)